MELKFSEIKELCKQTGFKPTELDLDDWIFLRENEIHDYVKEYCVQETVVYFNAHFLAGLTRIPAIAIEAIQKTEDNEAMLELVEDTCGLDELVDHAICSDGAGHFISSYDGEEIYLGNDLFAYRIN